MAKRPYEHACWKQLRLQILDRDHWQCQIRLDGCTKQATEVDHITPIELGGPWFDPANLRGACAPCNRTLGAELTNKIRRRTRPSRAW